MGGKAFTKNNFLKDFFSLLIMKVGSVKEFGKWQEDNWVWKIKLGRNVFKWEMVQWG